MKRVLPSNTKILCCITTKNAEKTIVGTLKSFSKELLDFLEEIVVIDNGSSDQTVQMTKVFLASEKFNQHKVTLLQNSANYGLGGSHKIAFKYALDNQYDYLLVVHGDESSNPNQFLKVLRGDFYKYDMVLSSRLASHTKRTNFQPERLFFNRILSVIASLLCGKKIEDFSGGGLSLFRVQSFINKYENPLKYFGNDISIVQFLILYSVFRNNRFYFHSIDCNEPDKKTFSRMASQFVKSILLLLKCRVYARQTLVKDVYGTYFGHNFRKIKIREEVADLIPELTPVPTAPAEPIEATVAEVFKFTDLKRLAIKDNYSDSFNEINFNVISSIEKYGSGLLALQIDLDVNNLIGQGLKSLMLRIFKIYPAQKIVVVLKANENILKTKQCFEFIDFLNRFKLSIILATENPSNQKLWQFYSGRANALIFNFDYGIIHRSEFYSLAKSLGRNNRILTNIKTSSDKFYYGYGLKSKLIQDGVSESVHLIPYGLNLAGDHEDCIRQQKEYVFNLEKMHLKFIHKYDSDSFGFVDMNSADGFVIPAVKIDSLGNIAITTKEITQTGNIFNESSFQLSAL